MIRITGDHVTWRERPADPVRQPGDTPGSPPLRRLSGPGIGWSGTSRLERALIACVVAAAAVHGGATVIGDRLRTADDIVAASRAALNRPPALIARIRYPWDATIRVAHDGAGTWRRDYPSSRTSPSFDLWMGDRFAFYDADLNAWVETDPGARRVYLPSWGDAACPEPERLGVEQVAGRDAYRIRCPEGDFWVDRSTHLVLRESGVVAGIAYVEEVIELVVEPAGDRRPLDFEPPRGARIMTMADYRSIVFPTRPETRRGPPGA